MYLKIYTKFLKDLIAVSKYLFYTIVINCTLMGVLMARDIKSQNVSVNEIYLTVELENAKLQEVFAKIEEQTDFKFTYFKSNIPSQKINKVVEKDASLGLILRKLSGETGVQFKRVNNNIYVSKAAGNLRGQTVEVQEKYTADITVRGKIYDETGQGLPGASVLVKGTTTGTVTDMDGNYSLVSPEDAVLVFSFIGYQTQEISVSGRTTIDVSLEIDAEQLEEVVVIGYGTQKKSDLTGAVGTVKGDELAKFATDNATNAIQGRMAGVRVESNGGAPGAQALVTIRGSGTMSDRQPLYVIDGMLTGNMTSLNPSDIESVTVLKDASASAIYGSRAANGVVIITTKKGQSGQVSVDFETSIGTQTVVNKIGWANAEQYAQVIRMGVDNDNDRILSTGGTTDDLISYPAAVSTDFDPNIDSDIQEESLRNAPMRTMNVRIAGGSENATYSLSAGFLDREGIIKESSFERYNLRFNSTFTKGRFKLEETIGITRSVNNPNNYFNGERDIVPIVPMYDADGNFTAMRSDLSQAQTGVNVGNSLGVATLEDRTNTSNTIIGNVSGSFEIVEGLVYKLNVGLEAGNSHNYTFTPAYFFSNSSTNGSNNIDRLNERNTNSHNVLIENTLMYKKTFGIHNLELLAGYSSQEYNSRSLGIEASGFPNSNIRVASQAETRASAPSNDVTTGLISYFGRFNYTLDDRYLLTATIRRDGSSLFQENRRWGVFPSFAVGWNVSNESFMDGVNFISDLKLRASYGEMGSNNADAYVYSPVLNNNSSYPLGPGEHSRHPGVSITRAVNEFIQWETTVMTDIGMEFGLMNNQILITMDYFKKESNDVIAGWEPPAWTGRSGRVDRNMASVRNVGFEFGAGYSKSFGDLNFSANANFTILDNEVTEIGLSGPISGGGFTSNGRAASLTDVGLPIGAFWGLKTIGIYQTDQEAIDDGRPSAGAGDLIFEDVDGVPGISADDMQYLGSPIPNFEYGLNLTAEYKGIDMTLFFNGVSGNKIMNGNTFRAWFENDNNVYASMVNSWTPENPSTTVPRFTRQDLGGNGTHMSDFLLEDGSYFRLRNMQIGYTLPAQITDNLNIARVRLYASVQNLFTITNYTGYYPEVGRGSRDRGSNQDIFNAGVDEKAYPMAKTYQAGLQVSF